MQRGTVGCVTTSDFLSSLSFSFSSFFLKRMKEMEEKPKKNSYNKTMALRLFLCLFHSSIAPPPKICHT
jgi:hypothetical protein